MGSPITNVLGASVSSGQAAVFRDVPTLGDKRYFPLRSLSNPASHDGESAGTLATTPLSREMMKKLW
jgi:hypothetical protein